MCGMPLYDDFIELRRGALERLEAELQQYGKGLVVDSELTDAGDVPGSRNSFREIVQGLLSNCYAMLPSSNFGGLPLFRQDSKANTVPGSCGRASSCLENGRHNFVLLCIPFLRLATKVHQPTTCRINSDQEFVKLLRHYYTSQRGRSSWKLLRKVRSIKFVQVNI